MNKKLSLFGLILFIISLVGCTFIQPKSDEYELTLVHINDVHGRSVEGKYDGVGMARVATIAKNLKENKNNGEVLLVDAGDTFHGTTFATLTKGESMVELMNEIGFNYSTLGNHDFNYGRKRLEQLLKIANYDILASNVVDKKTKNNLTKRYDIREISGKKVGFFGLSTPETYYKTNPKNVATLDFEDPITTAKKIVSELKSKGVDFIIAITHLGDDESTELKYQSVGLAQAIPEINLIIDGHSHTVLDEKKVINGVAIVQTGEYTKNVGVVKIDFDKLNDKEKAINYNLLKKDEILNGKNPIIEDSKVKSKIEEIIKKQKLITEVKIGTSPILLQGDRAYVRTGETNLSQLITDSMLWKTKADVAITNGGGIRSSINAGTITIGDVISVLPFGNYIITKELTGEQILQALENGLRAYPESLGGMAQFAGMKVTIDQSKPAFKRVANVLINGKPLDLKKKYIVATNDFMASGGDGYKSLAGGKVVGNYPGLDEVLIEYIQKVGIGKREKITPRLIVK